MVEVRVLWYKREGRCQAVVEAPSRWEILVARCLPCLHAGQKNVRKFRNNQHFQLTTEHTMLYLIGLGLGDETDITVKGLAVVKKAARVYLEAYTSILLVDKNVLVRPATPRCTQS